MDYLDNPERRRETQPSDRTSANSYGFGVAATQVTHLALNIGELATKVTG